MRIGVERNTANSDGRIQLSPNIDELISWVFPDRRENYYSDDWLCDRDILALTNNIITNINQRILKLTPGDEKIIIL